MTQQEVVYHPPGVAALSQSAVQLVPQLIPRLVPQLKLQLVATTANSTSVINSNNSTRSRAISACGQALDALTHLKQMRLTEQRANFQPYHGDTKRRKRGSASETYEAPNKMAKNLLHGVTNLSA